MTVLKFTGFDGFFSTERNYFNWENIALTRDKEMGLGRCLHTTSVQESLSLSNLLSHGDTEDII